VSANHDEPGDVQNMMLRLVVEIHQHGATRVWQAKLNG